VYQFRIVWIAKEGDFYTLVFTLKHHFKKDEKKEIKELS
jgi:hypothetical protein